MAVSIDLTLDESLIENTIFNLSTEITEIFNFSSLSRSIPPNATYPAPTPYNERIEYFVVPIVFAIIFIVGVIGNGTLIFIFIKYSKMRNPPNTLIMSLAVGDLLMIVFVVPFVCTIYTLENYPFGAIICKVQESIRDLSTGVTVFTLTALSAERYFAIVFPVNQRLKKRYFSLISVLTVWLTSIGLSIPSAYFSEIRIYPGPNGTSYHVCSPFPLWTEETIYPQLNVGLKFLVFYAVPLAAIGSFYCIMARHLLKTTNPLEGEAIHLRHRATQMAARRKVAKMVLAFVFLFAICFAPNHIFLLWFYFCSTSLNDFNTAWNVLRITGFCLSFSNSCINPVALYCISGTFRKYYRQHLCCIAPKESVDETLTRLRFHSSAGNLHMTKTENFEMSSYHHGMDKKMIVNAV